MAHIKKTKQNKTIKTLLSGLSPASKSEFPKAEAEVVKADGNLSISLVLFHLVFIQGSIFFPGKLRISQKKDPGPS